MSFNVDRYVEELLEKYKDDEHKWLKVACTLQNKMRSLVWMIEYSSARFKEELIHEEKVS